MILFLLGKVYSFLKNSTTKQKKSLKYRKRSLAVTIYQIVIATAPFSLILNSSHIHQSYLPEKEPILQTPLHKNFLPHLKQLRHEQYV